MEYGAGCTRREEGEENLWGGESSRASQRCGLGAGALLQGTEGPTLEGCRKGSLAAQIT